MELQAAFPRRLLSSTTRFGFGPSGRFDVLKKYDPEHEDGLTFRERDLTAQELRNIFPEGHPEPALANRLLKVLHARRVDGTLDLDLDAELSQLESKYPNIMQHGLNWLDAKYYVDIDAAVLARFRREEAHRVQENPSALMERGQRLGLFKPQEQAKYQEYSGPQSGAFYAELSEKKDDVFGRSRLEQIQKQNLAKQEEEERKFNEKVEKRMQEAQAKAQERSKALAQRPDQGIEISEGQIRPPNLYEKWVMQSYERGGSDLTLDSPEVKNMTFAQRVFPSLLFVLAGCGAIYLFTEYWSPPRRSDRLFPNTTLSMATVGTIFAINCAIFIAWKVPGAWRMLNRYFVVCPGYPRMFSMLGNIFSHQSLKHLFWNMLALFVFGPSLHEDVGRANFVAIYLASGLLGSWASMTFYLARGILYTTHQGASGCLYGIIAAYLWLRKDKDITFYFVPEQYRDQVKAKGSTFLWAMLFFEVVLAGRIGTTDRIAHIAGIITGISTLIYLSDKKKAR